MVSRALLARAVVTGQGSVARSREVVFARSRMGATVAKAAVLAKFIEGEPAIFSMKGVSAEFIFYGSDAIIPFRCIYCCHY